MFHFLRREIWPALFLVVPMTAFFLLRTGALPDPELVGPEFHFYIVSLASLLAAVVALVIVVAAAQVNDARVFFLGMAFLTISGIFFVHALTTPGFLVKAMNPWVTLSSGLSLLVGAAFLLLSTVANRNWVHRIIVPNQGVIVRGSILAIAIYGAVALVTSFIGPQQIVAGMFRVLSSNLLIQGTAALTVGMLVMVIGRYTWQHRTYRSPLTAGLLISALLLAQAMISMEFGPRWHLSWWMYHLLMLGAFATAIISLVKEYRLRGSFEGMVDGLVLGGSIARMQRGYNDAIVALVGAVEACDPYTRGHSERVAHLSLEIGKHLSLPPRELRTLQQAALLHDIGKIGLPDTIINKPGRLTNEEFSVIQEHPVRGMQIIEPVKSLQAEVDGILYHHERLDGSGYPEGLTGTQIPMIARIIAVADVFDALTSARSYRNAFPVSQALKIIEADTPAKFDPVVVRALHAAIEGNAGIEMSAHIAASTKARIHYPAQPAAD